MLMHIDSLAHCHLTQLCKSDLIMSSMLMQIKLCVVPESTIAKAFLLSTDSGKSRSLLKVSLVAFDMVFIQAIFAIAIALCYTAACYPFLRGFLFQFFSWDVFQAMFIALFWSAGSPVLAATLRLLSCWPKLDQDWNLPHRFSCQKISPRLLARVWQHSLAI